MSNVQFIRQALVEALPIATSSYGEEPHPGHMYVPSAHVKALRLECNLVIGARGVGEIVLDGGAACANVTRLTRSIGART
jgi:hypothetical protein